MCCYAHIARLDSARAGFMVWAMAKPSKSGKPLPRWAVRLLRKRAELLGVVHAPDEAAAIEAAVIEFKLTDLQRKRVVGHEGLMARFDATIEPMTLGDMRALGVGSLAIWCTLCHHEGVVDTASWPDDVTVPTFGPKMVCTRCGIVGADARPNWKAQSPAGRGRVPCPPRPI
jgi:hypothetical protein